MSGKLKFPKALNYYKDSDFTVQQKASLIYYIFIAAIVGIILLIFSTSFIQLNSEEYDGIFLPFLISKIILFIFFGICLLLLIKGKYAIATHLFTTIAMACVWYVMWIHPGNIIARLDTVVFIIALLNLTPLLITKYKSTIFFYVLANLFILIVFVLTTKDQLFLTTATILDFTIDTSIAIILTGIVGYSIFRINKQSIEKVKLDNEQKLEAEKALKINEMFRQRVFNSSKIPIIVMESKTFKYIDLNEAAIKIYGFSSKEESLGKTPLDVSAEIQYDGSASSEKALFYIHKALKEGSIKFEWLHQRPDGEFWDAEVHLLSFQSNDEILLQFSLIDISERKKAEKALKESQQLFKTLAQVSPVGIFRTKADGYTTYVNPKWIELSGLSFDEALGDGWIKAVHPDDRELLKDNWTRHSSKGKKSKAAYRFLKKDGSIVWVLGYAVPEMINSEIIGFIGTITDITELKKVEKNLMESEEQNRTIIEAFPDIIMISDLNKNIIFANDMLEKVTGITKEDYTNPKRKARIHPADNYIVQKAIEKLLKGKKKHTDIIENRFIDSWGNVHWFSGIISKMTLNNETVLQTITRDITSRKTIEKELEKHRNHLELLVKERTEELAASNEELVSTNEELHLQREELEAVLLNLQNTQKQLVQAEKMASLGVLASGVAHEINNPLNFIKGGIYGIEQYFDENLKEHKQEIAPLIEGVNIGIKRAANIVTSLNHYSRQNNSKTEDCDIHAILNNCLAILRNQIERRIDVLKYYTPDPYRLLGNNGKLHQLILNILLNAVQSIDENGTINIKTKILEQEILITITDSGCGISKENTSKIFDPFFTTKEVGKGTGLGLSIAYNILEEHKGSIQIDSKVNKGTSVLIKLPLTQEKG